MAGTTTSAGESPNPNRRRVKKKKKFHKKAAVSDEGAKPERWCMWFLSMSLYSSSYSRTNLNEVLLVIPNGNIFESSKDTYNYKVV